MLQPFGRAYGSFNRISTLEHRKLFLLAEKFLLQKIFLQNVDTAAEAPSLLGTTNAVT